MGEHPTPAEVESETKRLEDLSARMPAATLNMMKFMADPQVQEAMQRFPITRARVAHRLGEVPIAVFDVETTGFPAGRHRLVEIAVLRNNEPFMYITLGEVIVSSISSSQGFSLGG